MGDRRRSPSGSLPARLLVARWCPLAGRKVPLCSGHRTYFVAIAGKSTDMASYSVNEVGRRRAEELIRHRQYVVKSEWGEAQPRAAQENSFLDSHSWDDYAAWHLGLTDGVPEETKGRYAFVFGDFAACIDLASSRANTELASGSTRRSSSPPTSCFSCSIVGARSTPSANAEAPDVRLTIASSSRSSIRRQFRW